MTRRMVPLLVVARCASALAPRRRILVLHGKGGSAATQRVRFREIEVALPEYDFCYAEAPHAADGGRAWWTLPPGVRSFQAEAYGGVASSLACVNAHRGGVDAIWGHSQGAILVGAAAALGASGDGDWRWLKDTKLILNGASWPRPYARALAAGVRGVESLHVIGAEDAVNPPDHAWRLARCFEEAAVHVHAGGHYVPTDAASLDAVRAFLRRGRASGASASAEPSATRLPDIADAPPAMIEAALRALGDRTLPVNATLERVWSLAGDVMRHYYRDGGVDEFVGDALETAEEFPTSFYGTAINGKGWRVLRPFALAGGPDGWIGTAVVETVASDDRVRKWIWELRKRRRPPDMGTWYIESIGSSDADGTFDVA